MSSSTVWETDGGEAGGAEGGRCRHRRTVVIGSFTQARSVVPYRVLACADKVQRQDGCADASCVVARESAGVCHSFFGQEVVFRVRVILSPSRISILVS